jgi:hypothetical protein
MISVIVSIAGVLRSGDGGLAGLVHGLDEVGHAFGLVVRQREVIAAVAERMEEDTVAGLRLLPALRLAAGATSRAPSFPSMGG